VERSLLAAMPGLRAPIAARPALPVWAAVALLYACSAGLLLWRLPVDPPFPHNWEAYTAWQAATVWLDGPDLAAALRPTDGLMTNSGQGTLTGLPVWLGFALGGTGLGAMRVPLALVSAAAPPLLWLLARRLGPTPVAWLAAVLLALSPAWLLYGRTATIVAPSLVPLLLAGWALVGVLESASNRRATARRAVLLCGALAAGLSAYAPVRLLWPLAVGVLLVGATRQPARRRGLLAVALAALLCVPLALAGAALVAGEDVDPLGASVAYFHARGEQVLALDPGEYAGVLSEDGDGLAGDLGLAGPADLVRANAGDLLGLLADQGMLPTRAEYWNEHGRLWPAAFGALAAVGAGWTGWRAVVGRDWRSAVLLALAAGLVLPLLLTTRVHVGRLLPALPVLLLIVASGGWALAEVVGRLPVVAGTPPFRLGARAAVVAGLVGVALGAAAAEWATPPAAPREAVEAAALAGILTAGRPNAERAVLVAALDPALGAEVVAVRAAAYRLVLGDIAEVAVLGTGPATGTPVGGAAATGSALAVGGGVGGGVGGEPDRPRLLVGDAVAALAAGAIPSPCAARYAAQPEIKPDLRLALADACREPPPIRKLPR
jgi:hypothetical protein